MQDEFKNSVVVVTGAAQGIGRAVAEKLTTLGARVVALDLKFPVVDIEPHRSENYFEQHLDISSQADVVRTVHEIEESFGEIDYLVNVAGILHMSSLLDMVDEDWQRTLSVNTSGVFYLCQAHGRYMKLRQRGAIVVVGSNAAGVARKNMGAYSVSKAATTQLVKCLGLELAPFGIRCNLVAPGSTDTEMQRQLWNKEVGEQQVIDGDLSAYRTGIPLGKIAQAGQIADVILFLLSNQASHITMENIVVDGGATLGCQ